MAKQPTVYYAPKTEDNWIVTNSNKEQFFVAQWVPNYSEDQGEMCISCETIAKEHNLNTLQILNKQDFVDKMAHFCNNCAHDKEVITKYLEMRYTP